jgi:signal transduction histidine kinase
VKNNKRASQDQRFLSHARHTSGFQQDQYYQILDLAFLGSMLPGIIHNLSTPLSGVMGGTQLLEMRAATIEEMLRQAQELDEATRQEFQTHMDRSRTNMDIITRNAKHLSDILSVLAQRISRGGLNRSDHYPLNDLLQNELRFLDANLEFKHKVKKNISLCPEVYLVEYTYSHVANVIEEFVITALKRHDLKQGVMEMDFSTEAIPTHMCLEMCARLSPREHEPVQQLPIVDYLTRLIEAGWLVDSEDAPNQRRLTLSCPRRLART